MSDDDSPSPRLSTRRDRSGGKGASFKRWVPGLMLLFALLVGSVFVPVSAMQAANTASAATPVAAEASAAQISWHGSASQAGNGG